MDPFNTAGDGRQTRTRRRMHKKHTVCTQLKEAATRAVGSFPPRLNMGRNRETLDMGRLIQLVREREMLYNPAHENYRDAPLHKHIWQSIGDALGVTADIAKRKWWSKRDRYKKLKNKRTPSGQAAIAMQQKWSFFSALSFLDPYTEENNATEGHLHFDDISYTEADETMDEAYDKRLDAASRKSAPVLPSSAIPSRARSPSRSEASVRSTDTEEPPGHQVATPSQPKKRKASPTPTQLKKSPRVVDAIDAALLEILAERKKQREEEEAEADGDSLFMRSCLVQLKSLPDKVRMEAKIEIMNILYQKQFASDNRSATGAGMGQRFVSPPPGTYECLRSVPGARLVPGVIPCLPRRRHTQDDLLFFIGDLPQATEPQH